MIRHPKQTEADKVTLIESAPSAIPKYWIWIIERVGLPTVMILVLGWGIKTYWLEPDAADKANDRVVAAKLVETATATAVYQQKLIESLMSQTSSNQQTLQKLGDIVTQLSTRQLDLEALVKVNIGLIKSLAESFELLSKRQLAWEDISKSNLELNKTQILRLDELQKITVEITAAILDAREMMAPAIPLREAGNKTMCEILDELKKQREQTTPKAAVRSLK